MAGLGIGKRTYGAYYGSLQDILTGQTQYKVYNYPKLWLVKNQWCAVQIKTRFRRKTKKTNLKNSIVSLHLIPLGENFDYACFLVAREPELHNLSDPEESNIIFQTAIEIIRQDPTGFEKFGLNLQELYGISEKDETRMQTKIYALNALLDEKNPQPLSDIVEEKVARAVDSEKQIKSSEEYLQLLTAGKL